MSLLPRPVTGLYMLDPQVEVQNKKNNVIAAISGVQINFNLPSKLSFTCRQNQTGGQPCPPSCNNVASTAVNPQKQRGVLSCIQLNQRACTSSSIGCPLSWHFIL
eukprot:92817-Pelagomonas_calceolata.AAC.1